MVNLAAHLHPAAAGARADLSPAPLAPAALPEPATSFVGRAEELAAIERALSAPGRRLLTITGPGGIGKTRLALQAAARLQPRFAHGAAFVPLAAVAAPAHLPEAIAAALAIGFGGTAGPAEQLARALRQRELLLLLDNLEHLIAAAEPLAELLRAAPRLRMLVTSREPLRLSEEELLPLAGLPLADRGPTPADSGAAALFVERARRVRPGLVPGPDDLAAVAAICRAVEGTPLAIELAAAWARSLSWAEIAQELAGGADLLTAGARDLPARHRSLRATFDHSYQLLDAGEQRALRRLAVFRGGCTREAAAHVLGLAPGPALLALTALCDKSLLRPAPGAAGATRYELHELVRQYAGARLEEQPAEAAAARASHAAFFAAWVRGQDGRLKSEQQRAAVAALGAELDNIRAAWELGCARADAAVLGPITLTLHWFCEVRGWFDLAAALFAQGREALRPAALAPGAPAELRLAYWTLVMMAAWHRMRREPDWAVGQLRESLPALRALGHHEPLVHCLVGLAYLLSFAGDYPGADALLDEAARAAEAHGYGWGLAVVAFIRGLIESLRSDAPTARARLSTLLPQARQAGDPRLIGLILIYLSAAELALGQLDAAEAGCRESLALSTANQDDYLRSLALHALGQVTLARGRREAGQALIAESLALATQIGDRWLEAQALASLGTLTAAAGNRAGARALLRAAAEAAAQTPVPIALDAIGALVGLEAAAEHADAALVALAYLRRHPLSRPAARARAERRWEELGAVAGRPRLAAAAAYAAGLPPSPAALLPLLDDPAFVLPAATPAPAEGLTAREREVVRLIAEGLSNQAIAGRLVISVGTVKRHLNNIFLKLGVESRTQLIARCRERGLL